MSKRIVNRVPIIIDSDSEDEIDVKPAKRRKSGNDSDWKPTPKKLNSTQEKKSVVNVKNVKVTKRKYVKKSIKEEEFEAQDEGDFSSVSEGGGSSHPRKVAKYTSTRKNIKAEDDDDSVNIKLENETPSPRKVAKRKLVKKTIKEEKVLAQDEGDFTAIKKENENPNIFVKQEKEGNSSNDEVDSDENDSTEESNVCAFKKEVINTKQSEGLKFKQKQEKASSHLKEVTKRVKAEHQEGSSSKITEGKERLKKKGTLWEPAEEIAVQMNLSYNIAHRILDLFDDDNTIPFLARYRRHLIGDCDAETLRLVKSTYDYLKNVQNKAVTAVKMIDKNKKLTPELEQAILNARSLEEIEFLCGPYKTGSKGSKAERARQLGLEIAAVDVLEGRQYITPEYLRSFTKPGLETFEKVREGVQHIIADIISKDESIHNALQEMKNSDSVHINCSQAKKVAKEKDSKEKKTNKKHNNKDDSSKYSNYFGFRNSVKFVKPHQVLAINRGESQKVLSVKIVLPDHFFVTKISQICKNKWLSKGVAGDFRKNLVNASLKDAYDRLITPLFVRRIRSHLNLKAEQAAIDVFAANLKNLLLTPPLKGKPILAVDPGFKNGCKIALIDPTGSVLHVETLYILTNPNQKVKDSNASKIKKWMLEFGCEIIAIGNGTACREIESYLSDLIKEGYFKPELDVSYTIVNESGASIYSVSPEAKKEFPTMDPNLISAVSIGRRLQDPLSELVKIEPKHLGIGMYQHDVNEKQLLTTLNEIVVECVSFVGVDINTSSAAVLRKLAGMNQTRADNIIEWRSKNGAFTNRSLLRTVKGIGEKTFEQCAGFIRIIPQTIENAKHQTRVITMKKNVDIDVNLNPLDQTWIHPESYPVVRKLCAKIRVSLKNMGTNEFVKNVTDAVSKINIPGIAKELGVDEKSLDLIIGGLTKPLNHDFRAEFSKPLFKKGVTSFSELKSGTILTGRVVNVTHFGVFVDVGVEFDGLIHCSRYKSMNPQLGNRVEVQVENIDGVRKRLQLVLLKIL